MALIKLYGLPISIKAAGYATISAAMEEQTFNAGIDIIISDEEVMNAIINQADIISSEYEKLRNQFETEFDIKCPANSKCMTGWEIFCSDFATTIEVIGDAILQIAEFGVSLMLAPFNALGKNLSKNPLGTLMFVGVCALGVYLFLKIGLPILFPPAAAK